MIHCLSCKKYPFDSKIIPYGSVFPVNRYKVKLLSLDKPNPLPTNGADVEELPNETLFSTGSILYVADGEDGSEVYKWVDDEVGFKKWDQFDYKKAYVGTIEKSLSNIVIPEGITKIGSSLFVYNGQAISVTFPSTLITIESGAFTMCSNLSTINWSTGLQTIDDNAFMYCDGLISVNIPEGVTNIKPRAFNACTNLVDFTFPSTIQSIGGFIFGNCGKLSSITVKALTPPTLGTSAFINIASNAKIYVPAESVDTYKSASEWSNYASMIEAIPTT